MGKKNMADRAPGKSKMPAMTKKIAKKALPAAKTLREGQTKQSVADEIKHVMADENLSERAAIEKVTDLPYSTVKRWLVTCPTIARARSPRLGMATRHAWLSLCCTRVIAGSPSPRPCFDLGCDH